MDNRKIGEPYLLRLDKGDEILESIKLICDKERIGLACISGIGAVSRNFSDAIGLNLIEFGGES